MGIITNQEKGLKLQGSIHDVQYLFLGVRAVLQTSTPADREEIIANVQKEILDYNREFAERYNLAKPRSVSLSVADDVVSVLKSLGIIESEDRKLRFSFSGTRLASLLENSQMKEFRNDFTRLMLDKFSELSTFLIFIHRSTMNEELVLPNISVELLDASHWDMQIVADKIIEAASRNLSETLKSRLSKSELQKKLSLAQNSLSSEKKKSLEAIVDQYLISSLMGPAVTSKRKYDVIRDQCISLFLVNSGFFREGELSCEAVFLTSWLYPDMTTPANTREFNELYLTSGKRIRIHEPSSSAFRTEFKENLVSVYRNLEPEFGFVEVSDLRNHVCRALRVSDRLFDSEIVRLYQEEPQTFGLSYSFKKVTSKRLPILIGDTLKTSYNQIKIS